MFHYYLFRLHPNSVFLFLLRSFVCLLRHLLSMPLWSLYSFDHAFARYLSVFARKRNPLVEHRWQSKEENHRTCCVFIGIFFSQSIARWRENQSNSRRRRRTRKCSIVYTMCEADKKNGISLFGIFFCLYACRSISSLLDEEEWKKWKFWLFVSSMLTIEINLFEEKKKKAEVESSSSEDLRTFM